MQQGVKFTEVWHIVSFLLVLLFDITHTNTHTQRHATHSEISRLTDSYKYIITPPITWSQQLPLLHWMSNSLISKTYFLKYLFFSKNYSLVKVKYLLIRCFKTRFLQWNTNNTVWNGVNIQNTRRQTPKIQWKITLERVSCMKISGTPF